MSKYSTLSINTQDPNNSTTKIFSKVKNKSLVLDVGCASGYFANLISKEKECDVIGIEVDKNDAEKAEKYCKFVLTDDIEGDLWEKKLESYKFDHIIFADVLEHLTDPRRVLERVKKYLKNDGTVLISIPNIAHISIRIELLSGKFIPEATGILDNTHLKYFTAESFSDLVKNSGYKVKSFSASTFDFPEEQIKKFFSDLGFTISQKGVKLLTSQDSTAYQYFFEIVSNSSKVKIDRSKEKPINVIRDHLTAIQTQFENFKQKEKELNEQLYVNEKTIEQLTRELKLIKSSRSWKLAQLIKSLRRKLGG